MNLYLVSQGSQSSSMAFESMVVAAPSKKVAANMHPETGEPIVWDFHPRADNWPWAGEPDDVDVEYIGKAKAGTPRGVICVSACRE